MDNIDSEGGGPAPADQDIDSTSNNSSAGDVNFISADELESDAGNNSTDTDKESKGVSSDPGELDPGPKSEISEEANQEPAESESDII